MSSKPVLYQDFVDSARSALPFNTAPNELSCSICLKEYGDAGPGIETHLDIMNELPGTFRKTARVPSLRAGSVRVFVPRHITFSSICKEFNYEAMLI
jgi:hypothetical protein